MVHIEDLNFELNELMVGSFKAITRRLESAGVRNLVEAPIKGDFAEFDPSGESETIRQAAQYEPQLSDFGF